MNKFVNSILKKKTSISIFLASVFVISSAVTFALIKNAENKEYKYYTMPNGTVIRYQGKTIKPDANGIIVIPKGGASVVTPNNK